MGRYFIPDEHMEEYLRRNLLHCSAVGATAGAKAALDRILKRTRPEKWLVKILEGVVERAEKVQHEMAAHRDELTTTH